jgi:hypothetical protein
MHQSMPHRFSHIILPSISPICLTALNFKYCICQWLTQFLSSCFSFQMHKILVAHTTSFHQNSAFLQKCLALSGAVSSLVGHYWKLPIKLDFLSWERPSSHSPVLRCSGCFAWKCWQKLHWPKHCSLSQFYKQCLTSAPDLAKHIGTLTQIQWFEPFHHFDSKSSSERNFQSPSSLINPPVTILT